MPKKLLIQSIHAPGRGIDAENAASSHSGSPTPTP